MTSPSRSPDSPTDLVDQVGAGGGGGLNVRGMLPSLALSAIAPFVVYTVLTGQGVSDVPALIASGVFPLLWTIWGLVRDRRADVIAVISLAFIVVGVATSFLTGNAQFILIKESLLTGVFGLVCLISLLTPKPLMFYFGRQFAGAGDPARIAAFEALWQYPNFRTVQRNITLAWGVGYLAEAVVRVVLTFALPIPVFLIVSPLMAFGVTVALIAWTMAYARRASRRGVEKMAEMAEMARAQTNP